MNPKVIKFYPYTATREFVPPPLTKFSNIGYTMSILTLIHYKTNKEYWSATHYLPGNHASSFIESYKNWKLLQEGEEGQ